LTYPIIYDILPALKILVLLNSTFLINKMKKLLSILLTIPFYFILTGNVLAATSCQPIYGGGETCIQTGNVLLDKTVQNPSNGLYVDSLNINDTRFTPGQTVNFNITIRNTEDANLSKVTVKDVLPQYVNYVSGPGTYDANTHTLTFEIADFPKNEARTYEVKGKIANSDKFPFSDGVTCVVNQAIMNASNGQNAQDNAQLCIETKVKGAETKGGLPVYPAPEIKTTPSTGPGTLPLLALIPSAIAGFVLRRKSK